MSGKGDDRRPSKVDEQTFSDNWERVFGNKLVGVGVTGSTESSNLSGSRSSLEPPANKYVDDDTG